MTMTRLKWLFYKHYVWIGLGFVALIVKLLSDIDWRPEATITGLAAVGGYFHFAQKQRLEEMQLFKDLFTEFNKRYDELNDDLARVKGESIACDLERRVIDYFNLCAEEYLFFKHGYILPEAWESWRNGMQQYMKVECIVRLWESEVQTDSYYGLTRKVMLA